MKRIVIFLLVVMGFAVSARAQGGLAFGARVGTLGPGVEFTGFLLPQLNARVNANYLPVSFDGSSDDVDYDVDLRFFTVLGLLDWYPNDNNFRITVGLTANNNKLDLQGETEENQEIGDNEYSSSEIGALKGKATFNDFAPYIGIGYGNAVSDDSDISFVFDFGILIQGEPDLTLEADGTASGTPQFQADLEEEEDDAQDDAEKFKIYPVISFGIAYYFW